MATPHRPPPAARRAIRKLGEDIRTARLRRNISMEIVASRAATSRSTLARIEKGDPAVSIGIVAAVLQALNLLEGLANLAEASKDSVGLELSKDSLRKRTYSPRSKTR
ncbi:MAG: helix-turn-helix transcriptional regulator [Proteobacteria bacterium]|nr:helix-turn-helix transcriptional regulator [Pseudomonadota bacterium]MDA1299662.1 helix-turn-helix transcriptional regulator [Pseudomonadota bacterium]